jgi:hypothetical protein
MAGVFNDQTITVDCPECGASVRAPEWFQCVVDPGLVHSCPFPAGSVNQLACRQSIDNHES